MVSWWLLAACLLAGAVATAWPAGAGRRRLQPARPPRRFSVPSLDLTAAKAGVAAFAERPRRAVAVAALGLAVVGWLVSGLVAGLLAAIYGALTARALIRRAARRRAGAARARSLDDLCALAADLRAGLPPAALLNADYLDALNGAAVGRDVGGVLMGPAVSRDVDGALTGAAVGRDVGGVLTSAVVSGELRGTLTEAGVNRDTASALTSAVVNRNARSIPTSAAVSRDLDGALRPVAVGRNVGVTLTSAAVDGDLRRAAERRIAELTSAVWRLAERTGAPAADLVERIEADARTADRAHASAAAQAAGAQATALLLAALPLGGIALGYGIGVAPLQILFHTTLGGGCAIGAALLQSAGLLWADRLATGPAR
jgi:tight adherence protein B